MCNWQLKFSTNTYPIFFCILFIFLCCFYFVIMNFITFSVLNAQVRLVYMLRKYEENKLDVKCLL